MANAYRSTEDSLAKLGRSHILSARNFQYVCGVSGILSSILFFLAFVSGHFLPPPSPLLTAEQTVEHYRKHESGIRGGVVILFISAMLYLPYTAAMSAQIRRIPGVHYSVSALQLVSGASSIFTWLVPGMILAVTGYRLDRNPEITQALNDLFWMNAFMPWPTFLMQSYAIGYAVLIDQRPKPLFPKSVAIINFIAPLIYGPNSAMHYFKSGPLAWNGGYSFWTVGAVFCILLIFDSICLMRAVAQEPAGGEKVVDMFPSTILHVEENGNSEKS